MQIMRVPKIIYIHIYIFTHHVDPSVLFLCINISLLNIASLCPSSTKTPFPSLHQFINSLSLSLFKTFTTHPWRTTAWKPSTCPNRAEETSSVSPSKTIHPNDRLLCLSSPNPAITTASLSGPENSEARFLWARSPATLRYWSGPGFWSLPSSSSRISAGRFYPTRILLRPTAGAFAPKITGSTFRWRTLGWPPCWRRYIIHH